MSALVQRCTDAADDLNVTASYNEQADTAASVLLEAAAEIERLHSILDPELTFRDVEMKIRDGALDLRAITGDNSQPVFRLLAGIMLHFILGEGDQLPEDPPNYRSGEMVLKPAGGVEEIRAAIEVIKPGGKSSHQLRAELEAEVETLRSVVRFVTDPEDTWIGDGDEYDGSGRPMTNAESDAVARAHQETEQ